MPDQSLARSRLHFGPRNWVFLAAAVVSLAAGYWLLARGSTTAAPVLLVLGYCVFFPVGLALRDPRCDGRIAQSVQSACLTRRRPGVRIPLRPLGYQPA